MTPRTRTRRSGLLLGFVIAVVGGILFMHGLALGHQDHDMGGMGATSETVATAPEHVAAATADPTPADHDGTGAHAMMLCGFMLLSAGAVLLWWFRRSAYLLPRERPRLLAVLAPTTLVPRATGPPPAWRFSVIRC